MTSSLGPKAAPALIAVSEASKHIIQIIQLLEERNLSFSLCLNKGDILVLCGFVLLYQTVDLKQDSKLLKDNEKLVNDVIKAAEKAGAPGCYHLKRVAGLLITVDEPPPQSLPTPPRQSPDNCFTAPPAQRHSISSSSKPSATLGRHIAASMSENDLLMQQEKLRRITMSHPTAPRTEQVQPRSRASFDGQRQPNSLSQRDHRLSLSQAHAAQAALLARLSTSPHAKHQSMDYLRMDSPTQPDSPVHSRGSAGANAITHTQQAQLYSQLQKGASVSTAEWEALLGSIEGGHLNVYDAIYGGPGLSLADAANAPVSATPTTTTTEAWSPDSWDLTSFNLGDFGSAATTTGSSHSVVSLSEDGLSSSDDMVSVSSAAAAGVDFRNSLGMPVTTTDGFVLDGFDGPFPM